MFATQTGVCYDKSTQQRRGTIGLKALRALGALLISLALGTGAAAAAVGQAQLPLDATDSQGAMVDSTPLGSYVADALREAAETDFAFVPSGLLGLNLPAGSVDEQTLAQSLPRDETVYRFSLTGAQLEQVLLHACSHLTLDEKECLDRAASKWDGFLQLSGLEVIYNVPALPERRLYDAERGGEALALDDTVYTAAAPASFFTDYGYDVPEPEEDAVGQLRQIVSERIAREGVTELPARRIILYGARENEIISSIPPVLAVFVVILMVAFNGRKWRRKADFER